MCDHNPYPEEAREISDLLDQAFYRYYNTVADMTGEYKEITDEYIDGFIEVMRIKFQEYIGKKDTPFDVPNKFIRNDDIKTMEKLVQDYYDGVQDFKEH